MSAPDITLGKGLILVTQSSSILGIEFQSQGFLYGYVELVNDLSDMTAVGDTIVFMEKDVINSFRYGSSIYYVLNEGQNIFKENPPL